jgi:hypothetical protein
MIFMVRPFLVMRFEWTHLCNGRAIAFFRTGAPFRGKAGKVDISTKQLMHQLFCCAVYRAANSHAR